jgi:xanthine dehydrogenase molybdopterin-binding subunit B
MRRDRRSIVTDTFMGCAERPLSENICSLRALGVIRATRVVSAIAAGRILNTKTATSQIMGGVVWGIGMALHEETLIDHALGRIMNSNIAEYHVPVNADVHDIKVIFVEELYERRCDREPLQEESGITPVVLARGQRPIVP